MNELVVVAADIPPAAGGDAGPCWERIGVRGDGSCPVLKDVVHCRNCPVYAEAGRELAVRPPPPGYTDDWTARLAAADPPPPGPTTTVVLFRVGPEWYALDVAHAVEVAPVRVVRRVPHQSNAVLAGLVNLRGELHLAVDLTTLFGGPTVEPRPVDAAGRRLLVIERDGVRWVIVADAVHDIRHVAEAEIGPVPATVAAGGGPFTRGVFRWDGHAVGTLDPARLFAALAGAFR